VTRWTADSLPQAMMLAACAGWLGLEVSVAAANVRAVVRDWRQRRYERALGEAGLIAYRIGSQPGQPVT
jgi:hypothetical protein